MLDQHRANLAFEELNVLRIIGRGAMIPRAEDGNENPEKRSLRCRCHVRQCMNLSGRWPLPIAAGQFHDTNYGGR
jgi:hypothetical protein